MAFPKGRRPDSKPRKERKPATEYIAVKEGTLMVTEAKGGPRRFLGAYDPTKGESIHRVDPVGEAPKSIKKAKVKFLKG